MSKSLAEEILKQKQEEQSKKEDNEKKSADEEKDKKNFWKYWKIYAVIFTLFTGSCVNLAYLYCKLNLKKSSKKTREIAFLIILNFFLSSKIDFWSFLKLQKMKFGQKKIS